jgi:predicted phage tail protein
MLIKFYGEFDYLEPLKLEVGDIRQVLAGIKHILGNELRDKIASNEMYLILEDSKGLIPSICLANNVISSEFTGFDTLHIVPNIDGEGGAIVAFVAGAAFAASTAGVIVAAVINIGIAIAIGVIMDAISPTPSFSNDPSATQSARKLESNLYNGAPNIREQGGSVPLVFGRPNFGGVLISAGITAEEATL